MDNLQILLPLIRFTHKFQQTKRSVFATDEERLENDAEHSYQLAMIGWYLNDVHKLGLDTGLILKYALVHDLVEVYAGDTPIFGKDVEEVRKTKHEREEKALTQIKNEFPTFLEMSTLIEVYESKEDRESNFVCTLDKLLAPLNIYLDNGRSWHKNNVSLNMVIENKKDKIIGDPILYQYFEELVILLKKDEDKLFPKNL